MAGEPESIGLCLQPAGPHGHFSSPLPLAFAILPPLTGDIGYYTRNAPVFRRRLIGFRVEERRPVYQKPRQLPIRGAQGEVRGQATASWVWCPRSSIPQPDSPMEALAHFQGRLSRMIMGGTHTLRPFTVKLIPCLDSPQAFA